MSSVNSIFSHFPRLDNERVFEGEIYKERAITLFAVAVIAAAGTYYAATYLVALPIVIVSGVVLGATVTVVSLTASLVNLYWHRASQMVTGIPEYVEQEATAPPIQEMIRAQLSELARDSIKKEELRQDYLREASMKGGREAKIFLEPYKSILSLSEEEIEKAVWDVEKIHIDAVPIGCYLERNGYLAFPEEPYCTSLKGHFETYITSLSFKGYADSRVLTAMDFALKLGIEKERFDALFFINPIKNLRSGSFSGSSGFRIFCRSHGEAGVKALRAEDLLFQAALKDPSMGLEEMTRLSLYAEERKTQILEAQLTHLGTGALTFEQYLSQNNSQWNCDVRMQKAFSLLPFEKIISYRKHWNDLGIAEEGVGAYVKRLEEYVTSLGPISYADKKVLESREFSIKLGVSKTEYDKLFFADALSRLRSSQLSCSDFARCFGSKGVLAFIGLGHVEVLFQAALKDSSMGLVEMARLSPYPAEARKGQILEAQLRHLGRGKLDFEQYVQQNRSTYCADFRLQDAFFKLPFSKMLAYKEHWNQMGITSQNVSDQLNNQARDKTFSAFLRSQGTVKAYDYLTQSAKIQYRKEFVVVGGCSLQRVKEFDGFKRFIAAVLVDMKWLEGGSSSFREAFTQQCAVQVSNQEWTHLLGQMGLTHLGVELTQFRRQYEGLQDLFKKEKSKATESYLQEMTFARKSFNEIKENYLANLKIFEEQEKASFEKDSDVTAYKLAEQRLRLINSSLHSLRNSSAIPAQTILDSQERHILILQKKWEALSLQESTRSARIASQSVIIESLKFRQENSSSTPVQGLSAAWSALNTGPLIAEIKREEAALKQVHGEADLMVQLQGEILSLQERAQENRQKVKESTEEREGKERALENQQNQLEQEKERFSSKYQQKLTSLNECVSLRRQGIEMDMLENERLCSEGAAKRECEQVALQSRIEADFNARLQTVHVKWMEFVSRYENL